MQTNTAPNPIPQAHETFLRIVRDRGKLQDLYEARDMTEIVYRTMRDLMDRATIERVSNELGNQNAAPIRAGMSFSVKDLWEDTNPLVSWISRLRPAFAKEAPYGINDKLFLRRLKLEGGMPAQTDPMTVTRAVFTATKAELSPECIQEVSECLPGVIKTIWNQA